MPNTPIEQLLNCYGYFGFGGGYAMQRYGVVSDNQGASYCNDRCPLRTACWDEHRQRVRELFPDTTKELDKLAEKYRGAELIKEWVKLSGQTMDKFVEPYMGVMMGNMEDGARVSAGEPPKNRGHSTLTQPLTVRQRH